MKIQQMAFVLVAVLIFFTLISLFYFSIRISSLEKGAKTLREEEAKQIVRKLATSPEFSWIRDCASCVDLDKAMVLKDSEAYNAFWDLDYLAIEKIYPEEQGECVTGNYPNCKTITIVDKENYGIPSESFIALCRWEGQEGYSKCELGRIYVSGRSIKDD